MGNKHIYLSIASVVGLLLIFGLFIVFVKSSVDFDALNQMTFESYDLNDDLSEMTDGTYSGNYEIFPMSVEVFVTIENHRIDDILINRHSLFFNEEADVITEEIILLQSVNIAFDETHTSSKKILVLAILNALETKDLIDQWQMS